MGDVITSDFVTSYKQLDVYQRAYAVSLEIHKATFSFPKIEQYGLSSQLQRATKSVCANIAEGYGKQRHSKAEFKRFLSMAIGSCEEIMVWCDYCKDLGYVELETYGRWCEAYVIIQKMLYKLHSKVGAS